MMRRLLPVVWACLVLCAPSQGAAQAREAPRRVQISPECTLAYRISWRRIDGGRAVTLATMAAEVRPALGDRSPGVYMDIEGRRLYLMFTPPCDDKEDLAAQLMAYWSETVDDPPDFRPVDDVSLPMSFLRSACIHDPELCEGDPL